MITTRDMWEKRDDARAGNEWDSVVCGQTREGAPMYLQAFLYYSECIYVI